MSDDDDKTFEFNYEPVEAADGNRRNPSLSISGSTNDSGVGEIL